ncbi:MAG: cyclic nucleotide-binding domain-containing protein [Spirochaetaceae bacterium]
MGIKTIRYKANSIVYFKGDAPKRVYILKKGSLVTKATDLKTNDDILTMIKVGEFIGVKNVISNQPYSETVTTLSDSELVAFNKEDFEGFILGNNRIMMQTLVVFSNQLRKIHNDIKELNDQKIESYTTPETEDNLFDLGKYFIKQSKSEYSNYCFKRYKEVYPSGKYTDSIDSGNFSSPSSSESSYSDDFEQEAVDDDEIALYFQEGQNYLSEQNFVKAIECFTKVIEIGDSTYMGNALFFNGACLYKQMEYKACIQNYATFLTDHKKHEKLNEVLFYVGSSYKELGDETQATQFLKQVMKRAEGTPLAQLALKEFKGL